MATRDPVFLFWTKVAAPGGGMRPVKVVVDIDAELTGARRSVLNKSNRSTLGPVFAEALRGEIDLSPEPTKL